MTDPPPIYFIINIQTPNTIKEKRNRDCISSLEDLQVAIKEAQDFISVPAVQTRQLND